jgi:hypothetical protein
MAKLAFPVMASGSTTVTLTAEAGLLLPWGTRAWEDPTCISDRFFLGGLGGGTLRGFAQKGVGPSEPRRPTAEPQAQGSPGQVGRQGKAGWSVLSRAAAVVQAAQSVAQIVAVSYSLLDVCCIHRHMVGLNLGQLLSA